MMSWNQSRLPISSTCEVVTYSPSNLENRPCGQPTARVYPAGKGYMALCKEHARSHREAVDVYDEIRRGAVFQ